MEDESLEGRPNGAPLKVPCPCFPTSRAHLPALTQGDGLQNHQYKSSPSLPLQRKSLPWCLGTENTLSNPPAPNSWAFVRLGGLLSAGGDTSGCLVAWLLVAQLKFECSADVSVSLSLSQASGGLCTLYQALGWCPYGVSFFFHLHPISIFLFNPPF